MGGGTTDADAVVEVGEGRPCDSCDSFRPFLPSGDVIVWVSCTVGLATCDVERATLTGTVWSVSRIANDIHSVEWARTDGQWITYPRSGVDPFSTDICWQPVAGGVEQCLELPGTQAYPTVAGGSPSSVVCSQANLTSISSRIRSARIGCFSHLDAGSRTLKRRGRSSGRQTPDRLGFRRRCTTQRVRRRRHSAAGQHVLVRRIPAADRPVSGVQRDEGRGGRAGALQPRKRPSMKR